MAEFVVLGLIISLATGSMVVPLFHRLLRLWLRLNDDIEAAGERHVPPELTGLIERAFFMAIVAFDISGAATAMIGWIAAKMVAHWNSDEAKSGRSERELLNGRFAALLAGLLSMTFALIGGKVARSHPDHPALLAEWALWVFLIALVGRLVLYATLRKRRI